jgi:hypothetical protein
MTTGVLFASLSSIVCSEAMNEGITCRCARHRPFVHESQKRFYKGTFVVLSRVGEVRAACAEHDMLSSYRQSVYR